MKTTNKKLRTEIKLKEERLEKQLHELNDLRVALARNELTPAENYLNELMPNGCPFDQNFSQYDMMVAHEAGQKHGAKIERERFEPLFKLIRKGEHFHDIGRSRIEKALNKLEPKPDGSIIIDFISGYSGNERFTVETDQEFLPKYGTSYRATPIKD